MDIILVTAKLYLTQIYNKGKKFTQWKKCSSHILTFTSIAAPQNIHKNVYSWLIPDY